MGFKVILKERFEYIKSLPNSVKFWILMGWLIQLLILFTIGEGYLIFNVIQATLTCFWFFLIDELSSIDIYNNKNKVPNTDEIVLSLSIYLLILSLTISIFKSPVKLIVNSIRNFNNFLNSKKIF